MKAPLGLVIAAVMTASVAGCTDSRAGTPRAEPSSQPTSAAPSSSSNTRPHVLNLDGVDPCRLLTEQQLATFAVDAPTKPGTARGGSVLAGSPGCTASSLAEQHGFLIIASTELGLVEFLSRIQPNPSRKSVTVAGFPAVEEESPTSAPERGSGECYVNVDVADGQLLEVQFSQIAASQEKRLPIETLCAKATEVAEAALTTLQGG